MAKFTPRRQVRFNTGNATPLDRNAKVKLFVYAQSWSERNRRPGQHKGPLTRAFLEVLEVLLWRFHNNGTGACFPSYEAIAAAAGCGRSTVAEALKALEHAGIITWECRIARIREQITDLFGHKAWRWRVVRRSNSYAFCLPASKSENGAVTISKELLGYVCRAVGRRFSLIARQNTPETTSTSATNASNASPSASVTAEKREA